MKDGSLDRRGVIGDASSNIRLFVCVVGCLVDSFFVYDRFTFYRISVYSEKRFSEYGDLIIDIATE